MSKKIIKLWLLNVDIIFRKSLCTTLTQKIYYIEKKTKLVAVYDEIVDNCIYYIDFAQKRQITKKNQYIDRYRDVQQGHHGQSYTHTHNTPL